jgi:CheY-like chemotaxis protein
LPVTSFALGNKDLAFSFLLRNSSDAHPYYGELMSPARKEENAGMQMIRESPGLDEVSTIPATDAPASTGQVLGAESEVSLPGLRIRTIIADDELLCRETLRRVLANEKDIEIISLPTNGREALDAINRLGPDLVFLDVQMPELNGFEVVAQIHCARMPAVIFVTANEEFALQAFDVHAVDYVVKPCRPDRLQIALQRARDQLQRHQSREVHQKINALLEDFLVKLRQLCP